MCICIGFEGPLEVDSPPMQRKWSIQGKHAQGDEYAGGQARKLIRYTPLRLQET